MKTENNKPPGWFSDVENWTDIGHTTATLMLSSSEKRLSESVATSENITKRADRLLTIIITLLTIILGVVFKDATEEGASPFLVDTAKITLLPLLIASIFIVKNLFPYTVHVPGAAPADMLTQERFGRGLTEGQQYLELVINLLESNQDRISENKRFNSQRMQNNVYAQWTLLSLPFCPFLMYLVYL